jgi:hypothetical protein
MTDLRAISFPGVLALTHQAAERLAASELTGSHSTAEFIEILRHTANWLSRYLEYGMTPVKGDIDYLNFALAGIPVRPPTTEKEHEALLDAFVDLLWACDVLAGGDYPFTPFDAAKSAPFAAPAAGESPLPRLEKLSPLDAGVEVFDSDPHGRAFGAAFGPDSAEVNPLA